MDFTDGVILHTLIDTLNFGIAVLDGERKPLFANAKASRLMNDGDVFYTDHTGALRITHAEADKSLNESISSLHRGAARRKVCPIPIRSHESRCAMFAWVSLLPLGPGAKAFDGHAQLPTVTSLIITQQFGNETVNSVLGDMFNLTPAESRLLQSLLKGVSPSEYAARMNLSQNTVRNQLKSIFGKTEVRRQSDLVSLVSTLLAPVAFASADDH